MLALTTSCCDGLFTYVKYEIVFTIIYVEVLSGCQNLSLGTLGAKHCVYP